MKAVLMTATGGPEVLALSEIPEPQLMAADQVKVKLLGAGVNPIDTKLRKRGLLVADAQSHILGCDGAGEVVECGGAVTDLKPGDAVWFCHGGLGREPGTYAQYTVLPAADARRCPTTLAARQAAAGPLVLITAWEALFDRAHLQAGQTVLIQAGAGGVGHVAIQLAQLAGARVCTTASGADKAAFVRGLGAEHVIDHALDACLIRHVQRHGPRAGRLWRALLEQLQDRAPGEPFEDEDRDHEPDDVGDDLRPDYLHPILPGASRAEPFTAPTIAAPRVAERTSRRAAGGRERAVRGWRWMAAWAVSRNPRGPLEPVIPGLRGASRAAPGAGPRML